MKNLVNFFGFIYPPYLGCGGYTIRATDTEWYTDSSCRNCVYHLLSTLLVIHILLLCRSFLMLCTFFCHKSTAFFQVFIARFLFAISMHVHNLSRAAIFLVLNAKLLSLANESLSGIARPTASKLWRPE